MANFAGGGDTYTFDLVPTADGVFHIDIAAGAARTSLGHTNTAADRLTMEFDDNAPAPRISGGAVRYGPQP